jgi:hypothetical protein
MNGTNHESKMTGGHFSKMPSSHVPDNTSVFRRESGILRPRVKMWTIQKPRFETRHGNR